MEELTEKESAEYATLTAPFAHFSNFLYCDYFYEKTKEKLFECNASLPLAKDWTMILDSHEILNLPEQSTGLAFAVFYNNKTSPPKLVIAFRGTDTLVDWKSNLHWVNRHFGGDDAYKVLHRKTDDIIYRMLNHAAVRATRGTPELYSTGHSLGGGLAQFIAMGDERFRGAIVFNSTPVTGYKTLISNTRLNCAVGIIRVYETGEALSYIRGIIRKGFYPLSENIDEVAFNLVHSWGNPLKNHKLDALSKKLAGLATPANVVSLLPVTPDTQCLLRKRP